MQTVLNLLEVEPIRLLISLGAPIAMFIPAALVWLVVPFAPDAVVADLNVGILFFVAITSIGALGVVMAGYGSRSAFSLLGALRGAAQMISYEVPLILSLLGVVMLAGSRLCPSWTSGNSIGSGSVSRRRSSCLLSSGSGGPYPVSGWTSLWTWAGRYWFRQP